MNSKTDEKSISKLMVFVTKCITKLHVVTHNENSIVPSREHSDHSFRHTEQFRDTILSPRRN